jgi:flagellar hook protein FlgE
MAFQQGLSGLNTASKLLEVIGNNVSNSNTVGFKESRAEFTDLLANSITSSGVPPIGIGVRVSDVSQNFSQGTVSSTTKPLDLAIVGDGFFRMSSGGAISYARNGQFRLDKDGFVVDSTGKRLQGYMATDGIIGGTLTDVRIPTAASVPNATTTYSTTVNLDSRDAIIAAVPAFSPTNSATFNSSSSSTVFDSLGNAKTLQNFYIKRSANNWEVHHYIDNAAVTTNPITHLAFSPTGTLTGQGIVASPNTLAVTPITVTTPAGGGATMAINISFAASTQFGSDFTVKTATQNGNTTGDLTSFTIGSDGAISGRYTNGESKTLAGVVLSSFMNPNGLKPMGNGNWTETLASGVSVENTPGGAGVGLIQSAALEDSNVDLTAELVKMITAQRFYQANAQTIKTQDQVLQTLVNLR